MTDAGELAGSPRSLGMVYAWWRGDSIPDLPGVDGFAAGRTENLELLARLSRLSTSEVQRRVREENVPYLGRLDARSVCYGWSAHRQGHIGDLDLTLVMPERNRYLWDFVTLPEYRGRGLYPLLLQHILSTDVDAERFWIGHDAENSASGRGILKAGFAPAVEMWTDGAVRWLVGKGPPERAEAAAELFRMPLREQG